MYSTLLGVPVAPATDILVTVGAYMALYYTMLAWLNEGDEVLGERAHHSKTIQAHSKTSSFFIYKSNVNCYDLFSISPEQSVEMFELTPVKA